FVTPRGWRLPRGRVEWLAGGGVLVSGPARVGRVDPRPRLAGPAQAEALHELHADPPQRLQLGGRLDALDDELAADLAGVAHERGDESPALGVGVDAGRERAGELQVGGADRGDLTEPRVPRPHVVDGEGRSALELAAAGDERLLGYLDDQTAQTVIASLRGLLEEPARLRFGEHGR